IKNVNLSNIAVAECQPGADGLRTATILGQTNSMPENISLENVAITYNGGGRPQTENLEANSNQALHKWLARSPAAALYVRNVRDLALKNVFFAFESKDWRPVVFASGVSRLTLDGLNSQGAAAETLHLEKIDNLTIA